MVRGGGGGVSAQVDGLGGDLHYRGGVSQVPGTTPVDYRFPLSALRFGESVAKCEIWGHVGDRPRSQGNHLSGHADSFARVVSRHVLGESPRRTRPAHWDCDECCGSTAGRGQPQASRLLSGSVHVPVQSPATQEFKRASLCASAGRRGRRFLSLTNRIVHLALKKG